MHGVLNTCFQLSQLCVVTGLMHPRSYFSTRGVAGLAVSAAVPVDE